MVSGGFAALFSLFGLFYVIMGLGMALSFAHLPETAGKAGGLPPASFGWIFGGIGLAIFVVAIVIAAARFRTAVCIKRRTSRTFCVVVAAIGCLEFPYGTLLGVLTFIVLGRSSVVRAFSARGADIAS